MRILALLPVVAFTAISMVAQPAHDSALEAAVSGAPGVAIGTGTRATDGLRPIDFAIAEEPIACGESFLGEWLEKKYSHAVAQELVASYRTNGTNVSRIQAREPHLPILALGTFTGPDGNYDWQKLRAAFPDVRGVVRMSLPAVDSQGVYAVVHYEVLTPEGRAFENFENFEKRGDGRWYGTDGITGSLDEREPPSGEQNARGR